MVKAHLVDDTPNDVLDLEWEPLDCLPHLGGSALSTFGAGGRDVDPEVELLSGPGRIRQAPTAIGLQPGVLPIGLVRAERDQLLHAATVRSPDRSGAHVGPGWSLCLPAFALFTYNLLLEPGRDHLLGHSLGDTELDQGPDLIRHHLVTGGLHCGDQIVERDRGLLHGSMVPASAGAQHDQVGVAAEALVVDGLGDRGMLAADRALGVAPKAELGELHRQRVDVQQPAAQRLPDAQEQLHHLDRLDHAD